MKSKLSKAKNGKKNSSIDYDYDSDESEEHKEITALKRKLGRIPKNTWIIKPGENTNRGNGIEMCKSLQDIKSVVGRATKGDRTYII